MPCSGCSALHVVNPNWKKCSHSNLWHILFILDVTDEHIWRALSQLTLMSTNLTELELSKKLTQIRSHQRFTPQLNNNFYVIIQQKLDVMLLYHFYFNFILFIHTVFRFPPPKKKFSPSKITGRISFPLSLNIIWKTVCLCMTCQLENYSLAE